VNRPVRFPVSLPDAATVAVSTCHFLLLVHYRIDSGFCYTVGPTDVSLL
jgi:hypothetical protein